MKLTLPENKCAELEKNIRAIKAQNSKNVLWERFTHDFDTAMNFLYNVHTNNVDEEEIEIEANKILGCLLSRVYLNTHISGNYTALEKLVMLANLRVFINDLKVA